MAARKKDNQINLLPRDKFVESTTGRILHWLLSTFRIIVIVVEMIVMIAFLSRFWLDAKNSDLNDEIKQKQALIQASKDFENEFNQIQKRIKIFSSMTGERIALSSNIIKTSSHLPPDIFLTTITIAGTNMTLTGISPSEQSIAQTIANLETIEDFESVTLASVNLDSENEGLIVFTLNITKKI